MVFICVSFVQISHALEGDSWRKNIQSNNVRLYGGTWSLRWTYLEANQRKKEQQKFERKGFNEFPGNWELGWNTVDLCCLSKWLTRGSIWLKMCIRSWKEFELQSRAFHCFSLKFWHTWCLSMSWLKRFDLILISCIVLDHPIQCVCDPCLSFLSSPCMLRCYLFSPSTGGRCKKKCFLVVWIMKVITKVF